MLINSSIKVPLLITEEGIAMQLNHFQADAIASVEALKKLMQQKEEFIHDSKKTTEVAQKLGLNRSTLEKNIKKALAGDEKAKAKLEDYYDLYIFREFKRFL